MNLKDEKVYHKTTNITKQPVLYEKSEIIAYGTMHHKEDPNCHAAESQYNDTFLSMMEISNNINN